MPRTRGSQPWPRRAVELLRREVLEPRVTARAMPGLRRLPDVFVNNTPTGGIETLRLIPARVVAEIRFVRHDDAFRRFGSVHPAGVILLTTKR